MLEKLKLNICYPDGDFIYLYVTESKVHDLGETTRWLISVCDYDRPLDVSILEKHDCYVKNSIIYCEIICDKQAAIDKLTVAILELANIYYEEST